MRKLLNTLFVTNPELYIGLDDENLVFRQDGKTVARFPCHNIESIISFSDPGMSPAAMSKCMENGIGVHFLSRYGHYRGSVIGYPTGNVLLRKKQALRSIDVEWRLNFIRTIIFAKLYNQKWIIERYKRQYPLRLDEEHFAAISYALSAAAKDATNGTNIEGIRGIEGNAQVLYFSLFNEMILTNKETFYYETRSRRPPRDPLNALLSFAYSLLTSDVKNALTSVGIDPFIGFMHSDRPGRASLALDMIEELRGVIADRFVLSLVNLGQLSQNDFEFMESGAVLLTDEGRKTFLTAWHKQKQEQIIHPYLKEKIPWGLVPYVQALLLARFLREDLNAYPAFLWK